VIGDGWLDRTWIAIGHFTDGWVVKGLGVRKSTRETALYLLSHAGRADPVSVGCAKAGFPVRERGAFEVVTWFGSLAYNRLRVPPEPAEGRFCGVCQKSVPLKEWYRLSFIGSGPPPITDGVADRLDWRATVKDYTGDRYGSDVALI